MRDGSGGAGGGAGRYGTDGVVFGAASAATLTLAALRGCAKGEAVAREDSTFTCVEEVV